MRLLSLTLENFRNYPQLTFTLPSDQNVFAFVGPNAQGKTNLVEAIAILALGKSFRGNEIQEMIQWENQFFRVSAETKNQDDETLNLEVFCEQRPRKRRVYKVSDVKQSTTDFIGHFAVTVFSAEEIHMLLAAPQLRRRYFDLVLSQIDHAYLVDLLEYQKSVRHRNKLLKAIHQGSSNQDELIFWNEWCIDIGMRITAKRKQLLDFYNKHIEDFYHQISGSSEYSIQVAYKSHLANLSKAEAMAEMERRHDRDIATESTSLGPHRDDWQFIVDEKPFISFGSRGELRSMILGLKFAEREFFYDHKGCYPVLLLDDVFSELDEQRQKLLLGTLQNQQAIITTTSRESFDTDTISVVGVESGQLTMPQSLQMTQ